MKRLGLITAVSIGIAAAVFAQSNQRNTAPAAVAAGDWHNINRDSGATRFSPLNQINSGNVATLAQAWTFPMTGGGSSVPLVVNGAMFVSSGRRVVAIDGDTGKEVWEFTLPAPAAPAAPPAAQQAPAPAPPVAPPAAPVAGAAPGQGDGRRGGGPGGGGRAGGGPGGGGGRGGGGGPTASQRGVSYWPGDGTNAPRILFMGGNRLYAIDAATGKPAAGFGENGSIAVGAVSYGGTPTIYRNVAIIGAATQEVPQGPPGNPRAFDVVTGKKLWEFWSVAQPGQPGHETWGMASSNNSGGWQQRSGANMWAFHAPVDAERGIVYIPIGSPATNYYGGDRPGNNAYGNSIIAVEAQTGKYLWHFQTVHHDIWDTDMPTAGALFDFVQGGRRTPAIAHVGKSSYVYVLDRVTGKPLIEVKETPVPAGDVPTEWYSPTQPIPVRPRPLSRVSFKEETDLVRAEDTTPEHVEACRAMMKRAGGYYNAGPFTPFMFKDLDAPPKSTIQSPGGTGGVNWGGMSMDPVNGIFYVNAQNTTLVGWTQPRPLARPNPQTGVMERVNFAGESAGSSHPYDRGSVQGVAPDGTITLGLGPFFTFSAPLNGKTPPNAPCVRPPWAKLYAVNANTGQILWESTLGLNANLPEGKQLAGSGGSAGPTATAGGLVFVGATSDGRFRAFDAKTGKELWVTRTPANAQGNSPNINANPM
ncbi:MAG TPA: PQQ-binding-like beta-propeller repeat protein, partial [Vicinamibacterales bacterium]|nr:PQQ-binding-like beta-propeller repeat protein [Vicinamibacterales bacterium]